MDLVHGTADDAPRLLALFDDAIAWMVARGDTRQWGAEPWSQRPTAVARAEGWAARGGLWFADDGGTPDAGAIVLGGAPAYVPPAEVPELYVEVLLTAARCRGRGVGARLVEHALEQARERGARRLRVDCWAGDPALPAQYERLGFTRTGAFDVNGWPGAILAIAV
jgi:GNAT superfamily N-acetyltransferase